MNTISTKTTVKIKVFAVLKDYFPEEFEATLEKNTCQGIIEALSQLNPSSASILTSCRFAIGDSFINQSFQIPNQSTLFVIPPSSGG
ncbi:MAG: MoaD/ThiS family protein [Bacteroidota bacterium]|nr:MoaD/ThiS family protein [Bacteroidota bacterium]